MRFLKKISSTPLIQTSGEIIDSFNTSDDHTTNAPSLNAVETSVIMKPIILYENTSGTSGNVTLNDSVVNYSYIEIYYSKQNTWFSTKISNVDQSVTLYQCYYLDSNILQELWKRINISGNTITSVKGIARNSTTSGNGIPFEENAIRIYRVLGYK